MTFESSFQFTIYLFGPLLIAFGIASRLRVRWRVFGVGFPAFLASQVGVSLFSIGGALIAVVLGTSVSFASAVVGALGAGVCEEYCRYFAFRHLQRKNIEPSWNNGLMYAVGHSGAETMLVGVGLLVALLAVLLVPDQLDAETLEGLSAVGELGLLKSSLLAVERLLGGLIIHLAFTCLVVLSLLKNQKVFLLAAILWHALHDMVFLQPSVQEALHESDILHAAVIGSLLVAYLFAAYGFRRLCASAKAT